MTLIINEMAETQWNCCCIKAIGILANDASSDRTEYGSLFEAPIPLSGGVIRVTFPHKDLKYLYGHHLRLAPRFRPLG